MKYIVTENEEGKQEIFMFPKRYNHDDMADTVNHLKSFKNHNPREWARKYKKPIAAGFTDGSHCHGRSETLDLSSRGDRDAMLLRA